MKEGHAFLPPSSAAKWKACAKWPSMNRDYPQESGPAAREGTAAHWVLEQMLNDDNTPLPPIAPNGVEITEEMKEGATLVLETLAERVSGWSLMVEAWVAINRIHTNCWGRLDIRATNAMERILEIIDYKFGHTYVEECGNEQGIAYATGALEGLPQPELWTVNITIIQPRCYGKPAVRTWSTKPGELDPHIEELRIAALKAHEPNPKGTPGKQCEWCPGRHACPELEAQTLVDAVTAFEVLPVEVTAIQTAEELTKLEDALVRLEARVTGLREVVTNYLQRGALIQGYALEPGRGKTVWSVPYEQIVALGRLMGKDLIKLGTLTPKQAQKAGIPESIIKEYSQDLLGETKLVRVNHNEAVKAFGGN